MPAAPAIQIRSFISGAIEENVFSRFLSVDAWTALNYQIASFSSALVVLQSAVDPDFQLIFAGSGFTQDGAALGSDGEVSYVSFYHGGAQQAEISGLSIPMATLGGILAADYSVGGAYDLIDRIRQTHPAQEILLDETAAPGATAYETRQDGPDFYQGGDGANALVLTTGHAVQSAAMGAGADSVLFDGDAAGALIDLGGEDGAADTVAGSLVSLTDAALSGIGDRDRIVLQWADGHVLGFRQDALGLALQVQDSAAGPVYETRIDMLDLGEDIVFAIDSDGTDVTFTAIDKRGPLLIEHFGGWGWEYLAVNAPLAATSVTLSKTTHRTMVGTAFVLGDVQVDLYGDDLLFGITEIDIRVEGELALRLAGDIGWDLFDAMASGDYAALSRALEAYDLTYDSSGAAADADALGAGPLVNADAVNFIGGAGAEYFNLDSGDYPDRGLGIVDFGVDDGVRDIALGMIGDFDGLAPLNFGPDDRLRIYTGDVDAWTTDWRREGADFVLLDAAGEPLARVTVGEATALIVESDASSVIVTAAIPRGTLLMTPLRGGDLTEDVFGEIARIISDYEFVSYSYGATEVGGTWRTADGRSAGFTAQRADAAAPLSAATLQIDGADVLQLNGEMDLDALRDMLAAPQRGGTVAQAMEAWAMWLGGYEVQLDGNLIPPGSGGLGFRDPGAPGGMSVEGTEESDAIDVSGSDWALAHGLDAADTVMAWGGDDLIRIGDGDVADPGWNAGADRVEYLRGEAFVEFNHAFMSDAARYEIAQGAGLSAAITGVIDGAGGLLSYVGPDGPGSVWLNNVQNIWGLLALEGSALDDEITVTLDAWNAVEFASGGGNDSYAGGAQTDILVVDHAAARFVSSGADGGGVSGYALTGAGEMTVFSGVDVMQGGADFADAFRGSAGDEVFRGLGGGDLYVGGGGFDVVDYNGAAVGSVYVDLAEGVGSVLFAEGAAGAPGLDVLIGISGVVGSAGADLLFGGDAGESFDGGDSADVIDAGAGADVLRGGLGADALSLGDLEIPLMAAAAVGLSLGEDGEEDLVAGSLAELDGDRLMQFGLEDALLVENDWLDPSQIAWDGATLSIESYDGGAMLEIAGSGLSADLAVQVTHTMDGSELRFVERTPIGEVMRLSLGDDWTTLDFLNDYVDPVVFALAPTMNEVDPVATRLRNVTGTGAEIRLQEPIHWEYGIERRDHVDEDVTILVLEKGVHRMADGTLIQVGELETNKLYVKGFEQIAFAEPFYDALRPAVFSQVQSFNGTDWVISRHRDIGTEGFSLTMQEAQFDNVNHALEDVGWVAIQNGSGFWDGIAWQAGSSDQVVNGWQTPVSFHDAFAEAPNVVATIASYNGTDPASLRIGSIGADGFTAAAVEDQSADEEQQHGLEVVDWFAFGGEGSLNAAIPVEYDYGEGAYAAGGEAEGLPAELVFASGVAAANGNAVEVSFGAAFDNPVVIAMLRSFNGRHAAVAEVTEVGADGFTLRVAEPDSDDGLHAWEEISWIAVEAGSWVLEDGSVLEAGVAGATGVSTAALRFDAGFGDAPVVLAQAQGEGFSRALVDAADADGFDLRLSGEEAADPAPGRVGWLALDAAEGGVIRTGAAAAGSDFAAVETGSGGAFDAAPAVFAQMIGAADADVAGARLREVDAAGFELRADEDFSADAERLHAEEQFVWAALEDGAQGWGWAL